MAIESATRHGRRGASSIIAAFAGDTSAGSELVPALSALRTRCRDARVALLWPAGAARVGELAALVDTTIDYPDAGSVPSRRAARAVARAVAALREQAADIALIFSTEGASAHGVGYLCYLAGVPRRVGFSREFAGMVLSDALPPPSDPRGSARHLALLVALERRA